jgi:oligopeptide transport system substrate-binding protein
VHKATVDKFGKDWTKPGNMVGNGAYVLKDWKVNSKIVIEKNAQYWDAKNTVLTRVTYLPVEAGNAELKLYQSGDNDFVYQLPAGQYEKLKKDFPQEIKNGPILGLRYYALNNKDPMMKDMRVRKALSMVLDRDILAQKVTVDGQIPAYGVTVKGLEGADVTTYDWVKWPMAKRVEEAKKLLAEAGVKPGSKIKFTYNTDDY